MIRLILCFSLLGFNSCIFSGNDLREVVLLKNYYLSFDSYQYSIVMKENDAETDAVVVNAVDSIDFRGSIISGFSEHRYFFVEIENGSQPKFFFDYEEFDIEVQKISKGEVQLQSTNIFFEP